MSRIIDKCDFINIMDRNIFKLFLENDNVRTYLYSLIRIISGVNPSEYNVIFSNNIDDVIHVDDLLIVIKNRKICFKIYDCYLININIKDIKNIDNYIKYYDIEFCFNRDKIILKKCYDNIYNYYINLNKVRGNYRALSFYKINKCINEKELFNNFTYIQILSIILNLLVIRNISNRYSCIKLFGIYEAYNYLVYMSNSYDYIDAYNKDFVRENKLNNSNYLITYNLLEKKISNDDISMISNLEYDEICDMKVKLNI